MNNRYVKHFIWYNDTPLAIFAHSNNFNIVFVRHIHNQPFLPMFRI